MNSVNASINIKFRAEVELFTPNSPANFKIGELGLPTVKFRGSYRTTMYCLCEPGPLGPGEKGICTFGIRWGYKPLADIGEEFEITTPPTVIGKGRVLEITEILEVPSLEEL